jgi:hypothetical protein
MPATETRPALANAAAQRALVHTLESAGWELVSVDIDLHNGTARVEVKRVDGSPSEASGV